MKVNFRWVQNCHHEPEFLSVYTPQKQTPNKPSINAVRWTKWTLRKMERCQIYDRLMVDNSYLFWWKNVHFLTNKLYLIKLINYLFINYDRCCGK